MSKPFDATLKSMLDQGPQDWAALVGHPGCEVEMVDADISTVTAASDKVLLVHGEPQWLLDLNFQTGPDSTLAERMLGYNVLLKRRHEARVRSVAVLLTRRARLPALTGVFTDSFPGERPYLTFHYRVLCTWELSPESLLEGGFGTLPLVPISGITEGELPDAVQRMKQRMDALDKGAREELWAATYVLMGLRYETAFIDQLLRGVLEMEESATYQAILEKGKEEGIREGIREGSLRHAQEILIELGTSALGSPSDAVRERIESMTDLAQLNGLILRAPKAASWEELLS